MQPTGRSSSYSSIVFTKTLVSMSQREGLRSSIRAAVIIAVLTAALNACYTQHPITSPVPAVGTQIVAQLTDTGTVAMGNQLGPGVTEVEGVVAAADDTNWRLLMLRVDQRGVGSTMWSREPVTFPRLALTRVTERQLDKKRSWIIAGAIAATALIAARAFGAFDITSGGGSDSGVPK